jgi:hypothetical protein
MEALNSVMERYADVFFPGCGGSIDVVHYGVLVLPGI